MKGKGFRKKPKHKCLGFYAFEAPSCLRKENTWLSEGRQDIGPGLEGTLVISMKPNVCGKSEAASICPRFLLPVSVIIHDNDISVCSESIAAPSLSHPGSSRAACLDRLPVPPAAAPLSQTSPVVCVVSPSNFNCYSEENVLTPYMV